MNHFGIEEDDDVSMGESEENLDEENYSDNEEVADDDETMNTLLMELLSALISFMGLMLEIVRNRLHIGGIERSLTRRPITTQGNDYIKNILNDDPERFRQIYRMYPDVFQKLCRIIREKTGLRDTRYVSIEEMLGVFLHIVGQNSRYCTIRDIFGRSHWTVSNIFSKVLDALNILAPELMVKPSMTTQPKIRDSTRFYPYFKDCIGAIDGTHIPAMVSGCEISAYRNRHGTLSQNVLAACNFDLEFIYLLSGWEGSVHDSRLLNDALTRERGALNVPQGKFYLVDCGFPNRKEFLAPYRGVRYHLQDFNGEGRHPENELELFNLRHASLRNVIERIFGVFKSRFAIFKSAPPFSFNRQAGLVLACAGLHNFLRKECRSDEFPIDQDNDFSISTSLNEDLGEDSGQVSQSQEQQRVNANAWRSSKANGMWNDVQHDNVENGE